MWFHFKHKWKPVTASNRMAPSYDRLGFPEADIAIPMTDILWKCVKCDEIKKTSINGTWTLEQIQGNEDKELAQLKKMAGVK